MASNLYSKGASCRCCSAPFGFLDGYCNLGPKTPILLQCGHNICEGCAKEGAKVKQNIPCPTCQGITVLQNGVQSVRDLPLDLYTLGNMVLQQKRSPKSSQPYRVSLNNVYSRARFAASEDKCDECSYYLAILRCLNCVGKFCHKCFTKTHANSLTLGKHEVEPHEGGRSNERPKELCDMHKEVVEFFCNKDDMKVCSFCVKPNGKHALHEVVPLAEKNKAALDDIIQGKEHVKNMCKHLFIAEKTLTNRLPKIEAMGQIDEVKINDFFNHAHGLLQIRKNALTDTVSAGLKKQERSVKHLIDDVEEKTKRLKGLLRDIEGCVSDKSLSSVDTVLAELNAIKDVPCQLTENGDLGNVASVHFEPLAKKLLSTVGEMQQSDNEMWKLITVSDDTRIEGIPEELVQAANRSSVAFSKQTITAASYMSQYGGGCNNVLPAGSVTDDNRYPPKRKSYASSSNSSGSRSFRNKPPPATQPPVPREKDWKPLMGDSVKVTHVKNPSHFWVQLISSKPFLEWQQKEIQTYKEIANEPCAPEEVVKGNLYLAFVSAINTWSRVRVTDVTASSLVLKKGDGTSKEPAADDHGKDNDSDASTVEFDEDAIADTITDEVPVPELEPIPREISVNVYDIDYGTNELIPISRLHKIPTCFSQIIPLAIYCGFADLEPIASGWSTECCTFFSDYVNNKMLNMTVVQKSGDKLEIELGFPVQGGMNDVPGSIRDTLVFLNMAKYCSCAANTMANERNTIVKNDYFKPELPAVRGNLEIVVTCAETPQDFSVQKARDNELFKEMMREMNEFYNKEDVNDMLAMYNPKKGMPCVAKLQGGLWHRAEVTKIIRRNLCITYVDTGIVEVVQYQSVRRIRSNFMVYAAQAMKCELVDVMPLSSNWSNKGIEDFKKFAIGAEFRMFVTGINGDKLNVALLRHNRNDNSIFNLSENLVEMGHAVNTGYVSHAAVQKFKSELGPSAKPTPAGNSSHVPKNVAENKERYAVIVTHVENPSRIFFQIADRKAELASFMEKIQERYAEPGSGKVPADHRWKKGDLCALYLKQEMKWLRGRVTEAKANDTFEVMTMDYGYTVNVMLDQLRVLENCFEEENTFICECHIAGISPPGGVNKWPACAVTFLQDRFQTTDMVYIEFKGSTVGESLSVDIFIKRTIFGKALEPDRTVFDSTMTDIIDAGYALPIKMIVKTEPTPEPPNRSEACAALPLPRKTMATEITFPQSEEWRPPLIPLQKHATYAVVATHVDEQAQIFVHLASDAQQLDIVANGLESKLGNSPVAHDDLYWFENQSCVAQFELDNKWYRAQILKVAPTSVEVFFIDYGNTEIVKPSQLRKKIVLQSIPQLSWPCKLFGIEPNTDDAVWPKETLNFIHKTIVEKLCHIQIEEPPRGTNPMEVSLTLSTGENLGDMLVNMEYAIFHVEESNSQPEDMDISVDEVNVEFSDNSICSGVFPDLMLPPVAEIFPIVVIETGATPDLALVQRTSTDSPNTEYQKQMNEHYIYMERMCEALNNKAPFWPVVEDIKPGTSCCTMYSRDGNWFRAVVNRVLEYGTCQVQFVDYGNVEVVESKNVRRLPKEYLLFPRQHIVCKLHQLFPDGDEGWSDSLIRKFTQLWQDPPTNMFAQVRKSVYPLEIDIISYGSNGNPYLVYQNLIDMGLVKLMRTN